MIANETILSDLGQKFGPGAVEPQPTADEVPTFWTPREKVRDVLRHLKAEMSDPYRMFYDVTAIDERTRNHREGQPASDFTVVYHLLSYGRNEYIRIKVALKSDDLHTPTVTDIWPCANWYEREVWDMFGIVFDGHPHLRRILMPQTWVGHPLRKEHPARATEMGPFQLSPQKEDIEQDALRFHPEEWGMKRSTEDSDFIFLNVGPQHPGTHGV
ncbi:MAG: NADH-quinone oxidoreductase subunit C, partial [Acidobacteriota bacterium]|nr:NADH-quinone oxidoreductase subunit C [Acidobacteriota bacterium]